MMRMIKTMFLLGSLCTILQVRSQDLDISSISELVNDRLISEEAFLTSAKQCMSNYNKNLTLMHGEISDLFTTSEVEFNQKKSVLRIYGKRQKGNRKEIVNVSMVIFTDSQSAYKQLWQTTLTSNVESRNVKNFTFDINSRIIIHRSGAHKLTFCKGNIFVAIITGFKESELVQDLAKDIHQIICQVNDLALTDPFEEKIIISNETPRIKRVKKYVKNVEDSIANKKQSIVDNNSNAYIKDYEVSKSEYDFIRLLCVLLMIIVLGFAVVRKHVKR